MTKYSLPPETVAVLKQLIQGVGSVENGRSLLVKEAKDDAASIRTFLEDNFPAGENRYIKHEQQLEIQRKLLDEVGVGGVLNTTTERRAIIAGTKGTREDNPASRARDRVKRRMDDPDDFLSLDSEGKKNLAGEFIIASSAAEIWENLRGSKDEGATSADRNKSRAMVLVEGALFFVSRGGGRVVAKGGVDDLLKAGQQADKNGLTKAGRALQKHGDRGGSVFPKSTGNAAGRNQQGQDILDDILKSGNQTSKPNRFGGNDIFDNNTGRGVRFDGDGNMMGFLEP
jgi:hypothetical protein